MKLLESLKSVLLQEIASQDELKNAIRNKDVIIINYQGDLPGGDGIREIEPVCLGVTKRGNVAIRAWQREGSSHTQTTGEQEIPGWRIYLVNKILSSNLTGEKFNEPRPGFNPNGDKSFTSVYEITKF